MKLVELRRASDMRRSVFAAFAASLVLMGILAGSASAYEFRGSAFYARFDPSATAGQGVIAVDRAGGSQPRVHGAFVSLAPHVAQTIVFRSIGCGGSPSPSNRVLRVSATADGNGELAYSGAVAALPDYSSVRSAWSAAGSHATCVPAVQVVRITEGAPTDWIYLGLVKTGPGTLTFLAERTSADHYLLTIVVTGLGTDDTAQLRVTNTSCGRPVTSSSVVYSDTFRDGLKTGIVTLSDSALRNVLGLHVHNTGTGFNQCAPAVIMANTEG